MPHNPIKVLSADVESSLAKVHAAQLQPHATLAFKSPSPAPAWADPAFRGRLAYIVCIQDQAIPKVGQEAMMQLTGQEFMVQELHGSHNATFLSKPGEAAEMVVGFVEKFLKLQDQKLVSKRHMEMHRISSTYASDGLSGHSCEMQARKQVNLVTINGSAMSKIVCLNVKPAV